jgi:hypothetical protein
LEAYPTITISKQLLKLAGTAFVKRFVPDTATKRLPSYCVELVDLDYPETEPFVLTLYWVKLSLEQQHWWYARRIKSAAMTIQAVSTTGQRQENDTFRQLVAKEN